MRTLALDIGGVCLTLHPDLAFQALGAAPGAPLPECIDRLYQDYSNGVIGSWKFARGLQACMAESCTLQEVQRRWNLFLGEEIPETTRLLSSLWHDGWHVVFFSDTQPWHIERLRDILSYSRRIPDAVYSCDVGAQKPDAAMYQAFEERYDIPDLYLDDRQCNIDGALSRGWNAMRYTPECAEEIYRLVKTQHA